MNKGKIAITLDKESLDELDRLVKNRVYENRSQAIQEAVKQQLRRLKKTRLAEECDKLDISFERMLSEEGLEADLEEWLEY